MFKSLEERPLGAGGQGERQGEAKGKRTMEERGGCQGEVKTIASLSQLEKRKETKKKKCSVFWQEMEKKMRSLKKMILLRIRRTGSGRVENNCLYLSIQSTYT